MSLAARSPSVEVGRSPLFVQRSPSLPVSSPPSGTASPQPPSPHAQPVDTSQAQWLPAAPMNQDHWPPADNGLANAQRDAAPVGTAPPTVSAQTEPDSQHRPPDDAPGHTPPPRLTPPLAIPGSPTPSPSHSESSSDEDDTWHLQDEDTSFPDEDEMKLISAVEEVSALDHEHWEGIAFVPSTAPEYTPGASGRIEWLIEGFRGTKEQPNKELVMSSPVVRIGAFDWRIKFYPKGNGTEFLSAYVECLDLQNGQVLDTSSSIQDQESTANIQQAAVPLLEGLAVTKRRSVAAQIALVLYNPAEPRVHHEGTALHRFCAKSPDWGWTRFYGPFRDMHRRQRGQRQSILRNDRVALTAYVRIMEDETDCLWEHVNNNNRWDGFAMTGLQSFDVEAPLAQILARDVGCSRLPSSNLVSVIATWLLFKPFRVFLYRFQTPHLLDEPFVRPKPLIAALQRTLFLLRTQVKPGDGPVGLADVLHAMGWYGILGLSEKQDVVALRETLRSKLELEVQHTPFASTFDDLFGTKKDCSQCVPTYRAPVRGIRNMQEAVDASPNMVHPQHILPQMLNIELDRQVFDPSSRTWEKWVNRVRLDDHISVRGTPYTLFGFVVHREGLTSGLYFPVFRPGGPKTRWLCYKDTHGAFVSRCFPKRELVDDHEGQDGPEKAVGNRAVAYMATYVRDDIAPDAFSCDADDESWDVPNGLVRWSRSPVFHKPMLLPQLERKVASSYNTGVFRIIDSRAFLEHEGPGFLDMYDPKWAVGKCHYAQAVRLAASDSLATIQAKLAHVMRVPNRRQILWWLIYPMTIDYPYLAELREERVEFMDSPAPPQPWRLGEMEDGWPYRFLWIHVLNEADVPPLTVALPQQTRAPQTLSFPEHPRMPSLAMTPCRLIQQQSHQHLVARLRTRP